MSQLARFDFTLIPGQQIDAVIKVQGEPRGVIHGVVVDENNYLIKDAVVKLFESERCTCDEENCKLRPVTHAFTDDCGQFMFGPLCPDRSYVIKVWYNDVCLSCENIEPRKDIQCIAPRKCGCKEDCDCPCKECGDPEDKSD